MDGWMNEWMDGWMTTLMPPTKTTSVFLQRPVVRESLRFCSFGHIFVHTTHTFTKNQVPWVYRFAHSCSIEGPRPSHVLTQLHSATLLLHSVMRCRVWSWDHSQLPVKIRNEAPATMQFRERTNFHVHLPGPGSIVFPWSVQSQRTKFLKFLAISVGVRIRPSDFLLLGSRGKQVFNTMRPCARTHARADSRISTRRCAKI